MTDTNIQPVDLYALSDEQLMSAPVPSVDSVDGSDKAPEVLAAEEKAAATLVGDADLNAAILASQQDGDTTPQREEGEPENLDKDASDTDEEKNEEQDLPDTEEGEEGEEEGKEENLDENQELTEEQLTAYKETHEKLFKPFKANGKEMQIKTVDEAIQLMQMGANYHKKTQQIAPYMKIIHMLEKNNLTTEEDLSFLIDVHKKDPGALNKLLEDSGLDPLDLPEKGKDYKPGNHSVSESEASLRVILAENKDDPKFQDMLGKVMSWDTQSRSTISDHPEILEILADNFRTGAYDEVMAEVERRQVLGDFKGQSVLQAYRQVVDQLIASNASSEDKDKQTTDKKPQPSKAEADRQNRRKAASPAPAKPATDTASGREIDLFKLSDDELLKLNL